MIEEYQYYQVLNENAELTNANTRLKLRITELEANNKNLTEKNAFLRQRPDLPVDRIPAYTAMKATIDELEAECNQFSETWDKQQATIAELKREVAKRDYNPLAGMTALKEPDS